MSRLLILLAALWIPVPGTPSPVLPSEIELEYVEEEFPLPRYLQHLRVSAPGLVPEDVLLTPLWQDYERVVSCRWDDNIEQNLEVKKRLDERGVRATWYLNSNSVPYLEGLDYRPVAQQLLEGGHSIGSHALTHPYITYTSRNRMFRELAGVRAEWEAAADTLVNSHAFSFIDYRNRAEGDIVQADVIRSMMRAGIYHAPVFTGFDEELSSDLIQSIIMPPENQDFDTFRTAVDWAVSNRELARRHPLISHSMHGWYGTPAVEYGFDELERRLDYLNSFENFWHTNQNAYAAYRYQYRHTSMRPKASAVDNELVWHLERPAPRWLNDPVPLTLKVKSGERPEVSLEGMALRASDRSRPGAWLFDLTHTAEDRLPERIGYLENRTNAPFPDALRASSEFPGLSAGFRWERNALRFELQNAGDDPLEHLTVTFRLPVAWNEGIVVRRPASGNHYREILVPSLATNDSKMMAGDWFAIAQVDFVRKGTAGRMHVSCTKANPPDRSFPGPFTEAWGGVFPQQFPFELFAQQVAAENGFPERFLLSDGAALKRRVPARDCVFSPDVLDPEVVPTNCDWYDVMPRIFVLRSFVHSAGEQPVRVAVIYEDVRGTWLNGQPLEDHFGILQPGQNELLVLYAPAPTGSPGRQSGAWLRLANPVTGERLTNISWHLPAERNGS